MRLEVVFLKESERRARKLEPNAINLTSSPKVITIDQEFLPALCTYVNFDFKRWKKKLLISLSEFYLILAASGLITEHKLLQQQEL